MRIISSGTTILMESGCKLTTGDINLSIQGGILGMRKYYDKDGRPVILK